MCGSDRRCGGGAHVCGCGRRWLWWPRVWQWADGVVVVPICVVVEGGVVVVPTCVAVEGGGCGAHVCGSGRRR